MRLHIRDDVGGELACWGDFEDVDEAWFEFCIDDGAIDGGDVEAFEFVGVVGEVPDACPEDFSLGCGQEADKVVISPGLKTWMFDGEA